MAGYYLCTQGEVLNAALPSGLKLHSESKIQLNPDFNPEDCDETFTAREQQLLESVLVWLRRGRAKRERQMVDALVEQGYDPMEIAAVALKMARKDEKQRPIMPMSDVNAARAGRDPRGRNARNGRYERRSGAKSRPNRGARTSHESGMVRLMIDMGREHGLRPNDVVGALAYHANIPGKTIGKILINDRHTLVDVKESVVGQVLAHAEPFRVGRRTFKVDVAA